MASDKTTQKHRFFTPRDRDNIRWFWDKYLKSKSPWLLLVLGMILIQGVVYQQFLSLTESGLRIIFESGQIRDLAEICAVVFGLFFVRGLMSYLSPRLSVWLASNAVLAMRTDLIDHLMKLDLAYFERTKSSDVILRLVNQAQDLSIFVGQATVNAVRDAATVTIISGYLIYKSPLLFTAAIVVIPAIILMMQIISRRIKTIQANSENALGNYMTGIDEMTSGMRTVKIAGQEPMERKRLLQSAHEIRKLSIDLQSAQALVFPTIDASSAFVYVLVIGGGGYMAISPDFDLDGAEIITFLLGLALVFDPARLLAAFFTKLQAHLVILDSVRSILREDATITDHEAASDDFDPRQDIHLKDVAFHYSEDQPLFDGLNLTLKGGKRTAIVGATGSGKTTVLSLLGRLYDPIDGQILIGETPIQQIKVAALRDSFSVVAQDIVIFDNTVWENIKYVRPEATDEEIWAAAEAASIDDLIRRRGEASVGPKGSQLSGGQKQRIAIARAFLKNAPVLLLDEATSALDQKTEERVQSALRTIGADRTTVIVAHRLSAVADADWIYVLDNGRLVEEGTHDALIEQNGLYSGMYRAQKTSYG